MKKHLVICTLVCIVVACSEKQAENETITTVSEKSQNDSRKPLSKVVTLQNDTSAKDKQVNAQKKVPQVRFITPTISADNTDEHPKELLISPMDDYGSDNVGMADYTVEPIPMEDETVSYAEVMPEFPGGSQALMDYLKANVTYPVSAKEQGIQGTVYIGFVVYKDGSLDKFSVRKGFNRACEFEAIRVLKAMPKWIPAQHNGRRVNCEMTVPVKFVLTD